MEIRQLNNYIKFAPFGRQMLLASHYFHECYIVVEALSTGDKHAT
jgi:hypothetical protein